jgi:hypothetical protein
VKAFPTFVFGKLDHKLIILFCVGIVDKDSSMIHRVLTWIHQTKIREYVAMGHAFLEGPILLILLEIILSRGVFNVREMLALGVEKLDVFDEKILIGLFLEAIQNFLINFGHILDQIKMSTTGHCRLLN